MKKIGLLIIALIMAMGALGVGYAHWTGELDIDGTVNTGTFSAELTQDNGVFDHPIDDESVPYPEADGESCLNYTLYAAWADAGKTQDNAHATCVLSDAKQAPDYSGAYNDTMVITVTDAYPCYQVWVPLDVHCTGSVPIRVWYEFGASNPASDVCEVSIVEDPALANWPAATNFSLVGHTSQANAKKLHQCETARALVYIHPVQPAEEDPPIPPIPGATPGATYTFTITIHYVQSQ